MGIIADWMEKMKELAKFGPYKYTALPENVSPDELRRRAQVWADRHRRAVKLTLAVMAVLAIGYFGFEFKRAFKSADSTACDTPEAGFQCGVERSHFWGQYSPYYAVPSEIAAEVPSGCRVTFAQVLSRHGARDPTARKTAIYADLVERIHAGVGETEGAYAGACAFLRDYEYRLGADELTAFGRRQMVHSGIDFHRRYADLAARVPAPFVRSAGQKRVVDSAVEWAEGFHQSRSHSHSRRSPENARDDDDDDDDDKSDVGDAYPYDILIIPEGEEWNNTLSDELCTAFEKGPDVGHEAQLEWLSIFAPPITERLNSEGCLPGANLTDEDTVYVMDLCPYETVADANWDDAQGGRGRRLSPFCDLFSADEWHSYDYYHSLGKWYGYGSGHALAPTRGVGFANELVARLARRPVQDRTSTNRTLDSSADTFPLDARLYADFSHDNDMSGIYAALGLYNATDPLSNTTRAGPGKTAGYSASWSVPFAARMYVEKMVCEDAGHDDDDDDDDDDDKEELVRVLLNGRVVPLQNCGADALGRCRLADYIESLSFARGGGHWDQCFE